MENILNIKGISSLDFDAYNFIIDKDEAKFITLKINDISIYICNSHEMVLYPWSKFSNINLITVDSHSDTKVAFNFNNCNNESKKDYTYVNTTTIKKFEKTIETLRNDEHISAAYHKGYISTIYTFVRNYSMNSDMEINYYKIKEYDSFDTVIKIINQELSEIDEYILDIDLDFFCCKHNIISNQMLHKKPKLITIALEPEFSMKCQNSYAYNKLKEKGVSPHNNCTGEMCSYYDALDKKYSSDHCCNYTNYNCLMDCLNMLDKLLSN